MSLAYSADPASADALKLEAASLGPWQQRARLGEGIFTPGMWASWDVAKVLFHARPAKWWDGKRVLDIGANCGGLSLELVRAGASVTAAEPYEGYRKKIEWIAGRLSVPPDRLRVVDTELFDASELGSFDAVLCLGLVYHFRHPQMVLDYIGNIDADVFFFSTQTWKSDQDVMINRSEITPQYVKNEPLAGWHPSRTLFLKMLNWAGFKNPAAIDHPSVQHDWGDRSQTTTNSAYFVAERGTPVDVDRESKRFI